MYNQEEAYQTIVFALSSLDSTHKAQLRDVLNKELGDLPSVDDLDANLTGIGAKLKKVEEQRNRYRDERDSLLELIASFRSQSNNALRISEGLGKEQVTRFQQEQSRGKPLELVWMVLETAKTVERSEIERYQEWNQNIDDWRGNTSLLVEARNRLADIVRANRLSANQVYTRSLLHHMLNYQGTPASIAEVILLAIENGEKPDMARLRNLYAVLPRDSKLYKLSKTPGKLAKALRTSQDVIYSGLSPDDYAEANSVSPETVDDHIRVRKAIEEITRRRESDIELT